MINILGVAILLFVSVKDAPSVISEHDIHFVEVLTFATLISAVDPVAVLAIFEDLHVNKPLYFIVFGESLFNDAVVITVYNVMLAVVSPANTAVPLSVGATIGKGVIKFFVVLLGGVAIGLAFGVITCFVTRFTKHQKSEL